MGQSHTLKLPDGNYIVCRVNNDATKGIIVKCDNKVITAITGLDSGETVTYGGYTYTANGSNITRTNLTDSSTQTVTGDSTFNLLGEWGPSASSIETANLQCNRLFPG